ncbi:MAG: RNA polymerase sigma factor [Pseudomonadota bacterium]
MKRNSDYILSEWLVLNAQSGNAAALNQLLKMWYPKFLRYSTGQLHDRDAAKDVVQDTLIAVARKIKNVNDPVAFPKWAYQILHRRGVDHQRAEIRRRGREAKDEYSTSVSPDDMNPMSDVDTEQAVRHALTGLDGHCYAVVHLYYLHGFSLREISTICCVPVGTIKSRLHTARGKLRKLLEEKL